ncbi:uncharacterized protein CANTADRAFT_329243 [Suhomyces tanzawaensis NRRL Y-17324]|uniref:Uncharacterized protein n=1 Tax=Suhomyces tanzawaensis NRRL Y-17324 TaxID=984487 RepID=A0A1E4SB73_9ASCO|nr:uncharacterized protein CANTADRAFT_329243 [Suhomyces tanzawaensis NRRL Y-17324]ODV76728.1 hypothetical protein CANTADRAFT_329243 [Suhomyces tanzawaensis NRRL Y-17324]
MKLAEALRLKTDYAKKLSQLKSRIRAGCTVQEGDEPPEKPQELLVEYEELSQKLFELGIAINLANSREKISYPSHYDNINNLEIIGAYNSDEIPASIVRRTRLLLEALSERDILSTKIQTYRDILDACNISSFRMSKQEIKIMATMDVKVLNKKIDLLSKFLRLIDVKIQESNWLIEI